jgi:hypothetical protein
MKRLMIVVALAVIAAPAFAFNPATPPARIGILRTADDPRFDAWVEKAVLATLLDELRKQRLDPYLEESTLDEVGLDPDRDADYYVEIFSDSETADYGGAGVGVPHASVTLSMLASRMAAEVRVYRGRTLELVAEQSLSRNRKALLPTSVGLGGRYAFASIGLAFIERAQVRGVANGLARDAARIVTEAVRAK